MTLKAPKLDITQPVETDIYLPFQEAPMVVTGMYEEVLPIHEAYNKSVAHLQGRRRVVAPKVASIASKAVEAVKQDASVLAFDIANGTNFRRELKERRALNKKVAYAKRLGLI